MSQYKTKILTGSASNVVRVAVSLSFAFILPPLLVRRMSPAEYGAWILILQGSSYIALLDLGLQTAIGKFVAQYDAIGDYQASSRILSSSFALLCISALVGVLVIAIITWRVPTLFRQMPAALVHSMRAGILLVGISAAIALPFNAFLASFIGLQKYIFPTLLAICSKTLSSLTLILLIFMRGGLVHLAGVLATFNVATAACQFLGWRRFVRERADFSFRLVDRDSASRLAKFGSALSIWTIAILFVSGLDMFIVGHYDYANTGYYGVATTVTNFLLLVVASIFGPLGPAVSSMQSTRTSGQLGEIVTTATRLTAVLLCLIGLPILVGAYPLLRLWVGHDYAIRSSQFLQVLVLGNVIRQFCYPYALAIIATGKHNQATIAAIAEATVNITVSIYLVQRIGAIGVAIGTLVGAFVSVGTHVAISMKLTRATVAVSRRRFLLEGLLRPLSCVAPTLLSIPLWLKATVVPMSPYWISIWALTTLTIVWYTGLLPGERQNVKAILLRVIYWRPARK